MSPRADPLTASMAVIAAVPALELARPAAAVDPVATVDNQDRRHPWVPREWRGLVARLGLSESATGRLARRAELNATSFQVELMASGLVDEEELCHGIATELGLPLVARISPERLVLRERDGATVLRATRGASHAMLRESGDRLAVLLSPARLELADMARLVADRPRLLDRIRVVVPSALRAAVIARTSRQLLGDATDRLHLDRPRYSAKTVLTGRQGVLLGALLVAVPVAFLFNAPAAWLGLHIVFSLFFLACVALRMAVLPSARPPRLAHLAPYDQARLPVYSILVPLYREAQIVPQLLAGLSRLNWPRSKLEIKLICEAEDSDTLSALRVLRLHPCVEIIEVPPGEPRTKPRALSYALPMCSGELVTLFDAEDRPHPDQLLEAWQRFRECEDDVACLQAPLVVTNQSRGWLALMFAFEYSALFRGILPWLARRRLVLPLGGTSNHFLRARLEEVGGWDAYNVTEDADLGIRLARHGYRAETITRPTFEDAPETFANWLGQRSRWLKGWMQTWLVHMREPSRLAGQLDMPSLVVAQVLMLGMFVSALVHPVLLATLAWVGWVVATTGTIGTYHAVLFAIDAVNVVGAYLAFLLLGRRTLLRGEARRMGSVVLLTPPYWMAMSLAAWRALWQLYRCPHHWDKTDHPYSPLGQSSRPARPLRRGA